MRRTVLALAVASIAVFSSATSAAPPTTNVNVVNTPGVTVTNPVLPVEVTNSVASPVNVAVVNGTAYQAVSAYVNFSIAAGQQANGATVYSNTGSSTVVLTAISISANNACAAPNRPTTAAIQLMSSPPPGPDFAEFAAVFTEAQRDFDCLYIANFPGAIVVPPAHYVRVVIGLYTAGGGVAARAAMSGHTLP